MRRLGKAGPLALVVLFCALLLAGAAVSNLALVLAGSAGLLIADALHERLSDPRLLNSFFRIEAGLGWRSFFRQMLIVASLLRSGHLSTTAEVVLVLAVVARHGALVVFLALRTFVGWRRMRQCETRNMGLPRDLLPEPPPSERLTEFGPNVIVFSDLLVTIALAVGVFGGGYGLIAPAAVVTVLVAAVPPALLLPFAAAVRTLPQGNALLASAQAAVLRLRPVVILHFSGGAESVYQVNMWLETMERLDQPVLVLLRERRYLDSLAPTRLPVLCVPYSVDLMNFSFPGARVALYVANVGKNIHLLRDPALKSAFIGHGDSDKTASFNPYTKVYDEVWVAGAAGRERYLRAQVGVRADQIVLVGRPQLDSIAPAMARPDDAPFTVLYAPTWEGWTEDLHQSSLLPMGALMVRELLATDGVRVLFKPHPLTGTVDPKALAAQDEIAAMLTAAGPHHSYIQGATTLYECFDESDALISDISSVVTDYLWSEKPYFVTNNAGLPESLFRDQNPSAGAAYLIGPGAAGLTEGLAEARGTDRLRTRRREVRTYLLGDPESDAMDLFRQALANLLAKSEARRAQRRPTVGVVDADELLEQRSEVQEVAALAETGVGGAALVADP